MITLTNTTNQEIILVNHLFRESGSGDESYTIPELDLPLWANDDEVIQNISNGNLELESNGVQAQSVNDAINILKGLTPKDVNLNVPKDSDDRPIFSQSPFSDAGGFRFRGASFKGTCPTGVTTDIDYQLTEERWINGGRAIIDNIGDDDTITFQVIDIDNIFGLGANIVLDEFITEYYIPADGNLEVRLPYPARINAGLYLRLKYTSTHASGCELKCNLYLHWKSE